MIILCFLIIKEIYLSDQEVTSVILYNSISSHIYYYLLHSFFISFFLSFLLSFFLPINFMIYFALMMRKLSSTSLVSEFTNCKNEEIK